MLLDMFSLSRIVNCYEASILAMLYETCIEHLFDLLAASLKLLVFLLHCLHLLLHLLNLLEFLLKLSFFSISPCFILEDLSLGSTSLSTGLHEVTATSIPNYIEGLEFKISLDLPEI